jgi:glycosyltransferase involved in cell wall biosynthesis
MQRHTHELIRGLQEADHEAELISPCDRRDPRWLDRFYEEFCKAHRRDPFDVIHSESTSALGLVRRNVHRSVPVVVKYHGSFLGLTRAHARRARDGGSLRRELKDFLWMSRVHFGHGNWWRFRPCEWMVPSRQQLADTRRSHLLVAERGHVVPNGVDAKLFRPRDAAAARAALGLGSGPLILAAGRLNHEKGVHTAIAGLSRIPEPVRLVIVGEGEDRARLERLAVAHGLDQRVLFVGAQPSDIVAEYFAACDVYVFPTERDEAAPLVLVEALASAIPVIASDIEQIAEVIDRRGENGVLVPRGNPAALAEAVTKLLGDEDYARRVGAAGRHRVLEAYTLEQMVERTVAVYEVALGRRPHSQSPGWQGNLRTSI